MTAPSPLLDDRRAWNAAPGPAQDAAIEAVARALAPRFRHEETRVFVCAGERHRLGVLRHAASGALLHLLPGGTFRMGQPDGLPRELPVRTARVGPVLAGRFPLLQREWDALGGGRAARPPRDPDAPVSGVSWHAARAWLERAGDGLRLPREEEWELACRAGTETPFFWGPALDEGCCWYLENAGGRPHAVREHEGRGNAFGLVDVAGNVSEWCQDDLTAPMEGSAWQEWNPGKVHRGGSFDYPSACCRSGFRSGAQPAKAYTDLGLRLFRSV